MFRSMTDLIFPITMALLSPEGYEMFPNDAISATKAMSCCPHRGIKCFCSI